MNPTVTILYFAWVRERIGKAEETFPLPPSPATLAALIEALRAQGATYQSAFAHPNLVRAAVNQDFAQPETPLHPGDEIAFFPPVTGG